MSERLSSTAPPRRFVLDSSAVAIYLAGATGHDDVADILTAARAKKTAAYLTMFSLAELLSDEETRGGEESAQAAWTKVQQMAVKFVDVDRSLAQAAAHIKAHYALETGDPFAAALAERQNGILVTSNGDYRKLNSLVAIKWLPPPSGATPEKKAST